MVVYTATDAGTFRSKGGSLSEKLGYEFAKVSDGIATARIQTTDLTASMVSTALVANGVDIADGTNPTFYALFCADVPMTIVGMLTVMTEAYAKDTTDAKIEIADSAGSPVTKCTLTLPTAGRAAKTLVTTAPASAALAVGDILNLVITTTGTSGTGHVRVFLKYTIN